MALHEWSLRCVGSVSGAVFREGAVDAMGTCSNGISAGSLNVSHWVRSSISSATGNCVELGALADGGIAVRNSRDPNGPALVYTRAEMAAFVMGASSGEFDTLIE